MKKIVNIDNFISCFLVKIKNQLLLAIFCVFIQNAIIAQTTLLDPVGDGGFETGSSFAANGWTAVGAANNFWEVGTVATQYAGSNGVYVANTTGTYAYNLTTARTSHFHRDIVIPACATNITLSFFWKGKGEAGWDRCLVYTAPTTVTPIANSPAASSTALAGATLRWTQPNATQTTYIQATITGLDALAGTTVRFIFTWQNDASGGVSPGTAIDNISLTYLSTPAIISPTSSSILATSAILGGNITSVGCSNVTERGIYYSTTNGFADGTGTKVSETPGPYSTGVFTENVTGLTPSTVYYYKAFATNSSGSVYTTQGTFTTPALPSVFVNATLGTVYGEYLTVKAAFDAINAGTHRGVITITLGNANNQTITETAQAVLNKSGSGAASYTSISINPAYSNITVSASFAGACCTPTGIIQLNAAENVTIDGRIGSAGSTKDLTIENTNTGSWATALFLYSASNNSIRYCNIKSSTTNTGSGIGTVSFLTNAAEAAGCNNNVLEYCTITKSGANMPFKAISSSATSSLKKHQNNSIRNCTISDFTRAGIQLGNSGITDYNDLWTISNNTIFQSTSFAIDATTVANYAIYIGSHANATGSFTSNFIASGSFIISNNTIGGNGAGGNWIVTTASVNSLICGIYISASTTAYSEINGNIIQNFDVEAQYFAAICADKTKVKIGSTSGNTISGIILKHPGAAGGSANGIYVNTNSDYTSEIKNNSISFSTSTGNNYSTLYGIFNQSSTTHPKDVVSDNSVSNIDATKATNAYGIYAQGYLTKNHISKIKFAGTSLYGIYWPGGRATGLDYRVENNEVILGLDNAGISTAVNSDIFGIYSSREEIVLYYNSVLLMGTATTLNSTCLRLDAIGPGQVVTNNLFYNNRSGGTGKQYCISTAISTATNLTSSNNAYIVGTDVAKNFVGVWNAPTGTKFTGADKQTLANWTAVATGEVNSISEITTNKPVSTLLPNANLASGDNLLPTNDGWLCAGIVIAPTTDFINVVRHNPAPTTIGAYELDCLTILPIELLYFKGYNQQDINVLKWSTASEINNEHFTIEHSSDAINWEVVGIVKGAGNSTTLIDYSLNDYNIFSPITYYRLKQTDFNGQSNMSNIIALECRGNYKNQKYEVYPNPTTEEITISVNEFFKDDTHIVILNSIGEMVYEKTIPNETDNIKLSLDNRFANGVYFILLRTNDNQIIHRQKIIKN